MSEQNVEKKIDDVMILVDFGDGFDDAASNEDEYETN